MPSEIKINDSEELKDTYKYISIILDEYYENLKSEMRDSLYLEQSLENIKMNLHNDKMAYEDELRKLDSCSDEDDNVKEEKNFIRKCINICDSKLDEVENCHKEYLEARNSLSYITRESENIRDESKVISSKLERLINAIMKTK